LETLEIFILGKFASEKFENRKRTQDTSNYQPFLFSEWENAIGLSGPGLRYSIVVFLIKIRKTPKKPVFWEQKKILDT
jgi:hypothetical protein